MKKKDFWKVEWIIKAKIKVENGIKRSKEKIKLVYIKMNKKLKESERIEKEMESETANGKLKQILNNLIKI